MSYRSRYRQLTQLRAQVAYERRIAAFGLPSVLAPYLGKAVRPSPRVPEQKRRRVLRSEVSA